MHHKVRANAVNATYPCSHAFYLLCWRKAKGINFSKYELVGNKLKLFSVQFYLQIDFSWYFISMETKAICGSCLKFNPLVNYFSGFIISRNCNNACTIKGITIPKESPIIIPVYNVQRDSSIFPDPERFDPDRFSPLAKQSRNPCAFMPFGHGPHSCIGMRFALMQMKLVLAHILKKYRLEVAPDTQIPPDVRIKATLACAQVNVLVRWAWLLSNQTMSCFTNRIPMRKKIPENHKRKDQ